MNEVIGIVYGCVFVCMFITLIIIDTNAFKEQRIKFIEDKIKETSGSNVLRNELTLRLSSSVKYNFGFTAYFFEVIGFSFIRSVAWPFYIVIKILQTINDWYNQIIVSKSLTMLNDFENLREVEKYLGG